MKLNKNNIGKFFISQVAPNLPFEFIEIKKRDEVSKYSNNNYLWRLVVKTDKGEKVFFVKQAREYNKRSVIEGKPVSVDPARICGEYQFILFLGKTWGKGYVPDIYYFDPKWCVMVMSDVSTGARLLIEEFEKDKIYPELGKVFGSLLGKLHSQTYQSRFECCGSVEWRKTMYWLFEKHFGFGVRKFVTEKSVDDFYKQARLCKQSWIWGDAVHRNIFVRPQCLKDSPSHSRRTVLQTPVAMVDFDHAQRYDPAADCGILLAHWYWMGLKNQKSNVKSQKFMKDFWRTYEREFVHRFPPLKLRGGREGLRQEVYHIRQRTLRWVGIYLVSRTDGKSGSYFAKWPAWENRIRKQGIALFTSNKN